MFRRKEESAPDASPESQAQVAMTMTNQPNNPGQENTASSATVQAQPASATSSHGSTAAYSPTAQNQQILQPATRSASAGSYRPASMGDFARTPANARATEAQRTASANGAQTPANFTTLSDKTSQKTNRRVLTVGNDILLKGEIATCDRLVIEGRVEAKLSDVHTVEIAECGSFKGTAEVEDAEISGVFEGDLIVRNRLVIYASGEVRGNITYGEIEIERGGRLTGQIKTVAVTAAVQSLSKPAGAASAAAQEVKARAASKEFAA